MVVGFLDGRVGSGSEPLLSAEDAGVMYGEGVFETVLVHAGEPRDLAAHLARLANSARMLAFEIPEESDWHTGIRAVLQAWDGSDQVLRLVATRGSAGAGPTCYVTGTPVPETPVRQRVEGVSVLLLDRGFDGATAAVAPWLLTGAKTLSYAVHRAALRHAQANGADDVIFLGSDGAVLEGATSTVVVVRGHTLLTPPAGGVLDSITTARLIRAVRVAGWTTAYQRLTPEDLSTADGVFLISSVRLVAPVLSIDGLPRTGADLAPELLDQLGYPGP